MIPILDISGKCILGFGLALAVFGPLGGADAASEKVLYSFTAGSDGIYPQGRLLRDSAGNLYGTTYQGGQTGGVGQGTAFKLAPDGTETVLLDFSSNTGVGANPNAGFIKDAQGNLYSTAIADGGNNGGSVFEITANGTYSALYSFCAQQNCTDGVNPYAGLIEDSAGNFYGTTAGGGANGVGTVFKLAPGGVESVLYSFKGGPGDGADPRGGVVKDSKGNLYGTTYEGGANSKGTVFKLAPDGKEKLLYSFCAQTNCTDGAYPVAGLLLKGGNLYGTTYYGGAGGNGYGAVFEVTTKGIETVLHSFDGAHGQNPEGGLIVDSAGNFYGTTFAGGTSAIGTVFQLAPGGTLMVLHSFSGGSDGAFPAAGVILRGEHLYGTTTEGGTSGSNCENSSGCGTVFEVTK